MPGGAAHPSPCACCAAQTYQLERATQQAEIIEKTTNLGKVVMLKAWLLVLLRNTLLLAVRRFIRCGGGGCARGAERRGAARRGAVEGKADGSGANGCVVRTWSGICRRCCCYWSLAPA